jgi:DNA replication and repair protein RecF
MISSLRLQNFRSYKDASFEFTEGVNIIIGPNASGKTNIIEGLVYICRGTSFRALDKENIKHQSDWARLDAVTDKNEVRIVKLQRENEMTKKEFVINDEAKKRLPFADAIPVVLFEPDDLQQLTTSPERRRNFVDSILGQVDAEFGRQQRDYTRVLAQRNRLLKNGRISAESSIFAWNIRLSELGGQIVAKRVALLKQLNHGLGESYSQLASKKHRVLLAYQSVLPPSQYASEMLKNLERLLEGDLQRGFTTIGPHRDDIEITINDTPIYHHASRGETRTTLLALKMQETILVEQTLGRKPLLMLDDVFSELDGARRKALTDFIKDHQSFITTTDADVVSKKFTKQSQLISLS